MAIGFAPDIRITKLAVLHWTVIQPPEEIVLPDCVALGVERGDSPLPLIMSDDDTVEFVLMPLTPARMLVGARVDGTTPNLAMFNKEAAACCQAFFVSNGRRPDLENNVGEIGNRSKKTFDDVISTTFDSFRKEHGIDLPTPTAVPDQTTAPPASGKSPEPPFQMSIIGTDEPTAHRIFPYVRALVVHLQASMPLDRLDGFTFSYDLPDVLQKIEGAQAPAPPDVANMQATIRTFQKDGVKMGRVVARAEIGLHLLSDDEKERGYCFRVLASMLAHVSILQAMDEAFPDDSFRIDDRFEAWLFDHTAPAIRSFYEAFIASSFYDGEDNLRADVLTALESCNATIRTARAAFNEDRDVNRLNQAALPVVALLLDRLARLLGHCEARGKSAFTVPSLASAFEQAGLRRWADIFLSDLLNFWMRFGEWKSTAEFTSFNIHLERVLLACRIMSWPMGDGRIWTQVL